MSKFSSKYWEVIMYAPGKETLRIEFSTLEKALRFYVDGKVAYALNVSDRVQPVEIRRVKVVTLPE